MLVIDGLNWLLLAADVLIAVPIVYLDTVTAAALVASARRTTRAAHSSRAGNTRLDYAPRFAVVVPAHNEESGLGETLQSLAQLDYPADRYDVVVVADNCTDRTAEVARAAGRVIVYERTDATQRGKGYALSWIFQRLAADGGDYDAFIVIDADSVVSRGYLTAMARAMAQGARAMQSGNTVRNTTASPSTIARWVALTLMNHVRPLGRNALGASSTLNGNGMCLTRDVLSRHPWQAFGLTEDRQYYLTLVQSGERVRYVADAVVLSVMPTTFTQMRSQDVRWGADLPGEARWRTALRLLGAGLRQRSYLRIEAAVEQVTPAFSVLAFACAVVLIAALALRSPVAIAISLALCVGVACYVGSAFYLLRPPAGAYRVLLYAPGFVLWKLWVFLVLRRRRSSEWVRTARNTAETDISA